MHNFYKISIALGSDTAHSYGYFIVTIPNREIEELIETHIFLNILKITF